MMTFTPEQFAALGQALIDQHIADFTERLANRAPGTRAPSDHQVIEAIVLLHHGQYEVKDASPSPEARLETADAAIKLGDKVAALETKLAITPSGKATLDDRLDAIDAAVEPLKPLEISRPA